MGGDNILLKIRAIRCAFLFFFFLMRTSTTYYTLQKVHYYIRPINKINTKLFLPSGFFSPFPSRCSVANRSRVVALIEHCFILIIYCDAFGNHPADSESILRSILARLEYLVTAAIITIITGDRSAYFVSYFTLSFAAEKKNN